MFLNVASLGRMCILLSLTVGVVPAVRARNDCPARADFDQIVGAVAQRFYDKTFNGIDWPSRVAHYRQRVPCAGSAQTVAVLANDLLGELHASHTAVYTRTDLDYWGLNSLFSQHDTDYPLWFSGIWPRHQGGKWYARYVVEGSPAVAAGVRQGDELLSLNGQPFSPTGFTGNPDSLAVSSDGQVSRMLSLTARSESIMQAFITAADASTRINRIGARRIGYFHLWGAREALLQRLKNALGQFQSERIDALVVDLRGGYGGTSLEYLKPIQESPYLMSIPRYFVIDDSVRSGKEMIAATAARDHLAELVGSRSAGAFLGAVPARIDGERYFVLIAAFDGDIPGLPRIEGHGVTPTIRAEPCLLHCRGLDPQWERIAQLIAADSSAVAAAGPVDSRCAYDHKAMLALDPDSFDQALVGGGWRALAQRRCYADAADLIRDYREAHNLEAMILYWHEGQARAMGGQTAQAIELFHRARANASVPWGHYVDATLAFLQRDRRALLVARAALAALPPPRNFHPTDIHGKPLSVRWPPNLNVVDALLQCFDRSYEDAYMSCTAVPGSH